MSFFSWLMRKPTVQRPLPQPSAPLNSGAPASAPGRTHKSSTPSLTPEQTATTKNERMERRELLYIVVRDAMVCAGVLSASYKFKVLSLDPRGLQFLVMMDLAPEFGGDTTRLSEIEALVTQTAKARYNIAVTAVYWRINEHAATTTATAATAATTTAAAVTAGTQKNAFLPTAQPTQPARPAGFSARTPDLARPAVASPTLAAAPRPSVPGPLEQPSAGAPVRLAAPRFDPIEADEVAAFKQALATAAAARAPIAATPGVPQRSGPYRPAPVNDFPDTIMPEQEGRAQSLSNTQYGQL
jgi:hypothetical protein